MEKFDRENFKKLMTQRFFINPAFEIYKGIAGLYDLGPPATAIKANILHLWRQHFVLNENMLEIDSSCVTPEPVLAASGHVARFTDFMVKDVETGACFRADHLLKDHFKALLSKKDIKESERLEIEDIEAKVDTYKDFEMDELFKKYKVVAPETGNGLSFPEPFNLMFKTSIGPTGTVPGYLRPETAQGIFVNFKRLLEFNGGKLPFAAAQIGQAYRNEIAPRSGLLRVREFTLAEIEHFVDPEDKSHPKFKNVSTLVINAFPRDVQLSEKKKHIQITLGEAVKSGMINNETIGYFIGRVHLFLIACGVKPDLLRFRQHLSDEMAHYAADCWDAEIFNSYGWTECVGIADRSAFDLTAHSNATKIPLTAFVEFKDGARTVEVHTPKIDKGKIGKALGKKAQVLIQYITSLDSDACTKLENDLSTNESVKVTLGDEEYSITKEFITAWVKEKKKITGCHITPGVIEPSFGIGRILYSILEQSYYTRDKDEQRAVLSLPASIAPVKVSLLPLGNKQTEDLYSIYSTLLSSHNISYRLDDSGASIGKRYCRADEIGIPFSITIDFQTEQDQSVTLRERDSTAQVRLQMDEIVDVIQKLIFNRIKWEDVLQKYPNVAVAEK